MSETTQATTAPPEVSANGSGPAHAVPLPDLGTSAGERVMFAVMLLAGLGLLFLAVDGLSGYQLTAALQNGRGESDAGG